VRNHGRISNLPFEKTRRSKTAFHSSQKKGERTPKAKNLFILSGAKKKHNCRDIRDCRTRKQIKSTLCSIGGKDPKGSHVSSKISSRIVYYSKDSKGLQHEGKLAWDKKTLSDKLGHQTPSSSCKFVYNRGVTSNKEGKRRQRKEREAKKKHFHR